MEAGIMKMTAFLTGSSRGIGKAIRDRLLQEDYNLIGTSTKEIEFRHDSYRHITCDLADQIALLSLKNVFENSSVPEVVINNAGMFAPVQMNGDDEEWLSNWDLTLQVNLRASALISKWAVTSWLKRGIQGRLINITSRAGQRGDTQEYTAYAASKAGMIGVTKSIARSFGKEGITAYSIAPGFVDTDMARESIQTYGEEYLTSGLFLDRIAPPEQFAHLVHLLADGKLTHATGQTFHINSGSYLP